MQDFNQLDTLCFLLAFHPFCSVNTSRQAANWPLKEGVRLSKFSDISIREPRCTLSYAVKPSRWQNERYFIFIFISHEVLYLKRNNDPW